MSPTSVTLRACPGVSSSAKASSATHPPSAAGRGLQDGSPSARRRASPACALPPGWSRPAANPPKGQSCAHAGDGHQDRNGNQHPRREEAPVEQPAGDALQFEQPACGSRSCSRTRRHQSRRPWMPSRQDPSTGAPWTQVRLSSRTTTGTPQRLLQRRQSHSRDDLRSATTSGQMAKGFSGHSAQPNVGVEREPPEGGTLRRPRSR